RSSWARPARSCTRRRHRRTGAGWRKRRAARLGTCSRLCHEPKTETLSVIQPVRELDEEDVLRLHRENIADVAAEAKSARHRVVLARLLPDDEQRGARLVLPPQDVGRAK